MDSRYNNESSGGPRTKRPRIEAPPNHILLLTILNPLYPITTDVIHRITHTYGNVQRIVMIRKNGVQAMVELETTDEATRCKIALHGAEVYSGCCVLRIEYAKTDKLKVVRNNENTYDYTDPSLPSGDGVLERAAPPRPALLPNPNCAPLAVPPTGGRFSGGGFPPGGPDAGFRGGDGGFRGGDPGFRGAEPGFRGAEPGFRGAEPSFREPGFRSEGGFRGVPESPYRSEPNGFAREREADRDRFMETDRFREPERFREPVRASSGFRPDARAPPSSSGFRGNRPENGFSGGFSSGRVQSRGGLLDLIGRGAPSPGMYNDRREVNGLGQPGATASEQPGCVLMVYNLDPKKMNCEKLFNILCLYGNVIRVKFLHTKEGSAMVQMGDSMAVENVISNLSNTIVYEKPLQFQLSKQEYVRSRDVMKPYELPDSTESAKDYANSKDNRFLNPSAKNRPQAPCKTLHFFNTPPNLTEEMIVEAIHATGIDAEPTAVLIFPPKDGDKKGKTSGGLVEFDELSEAVDVLVTANHTKMSTKTSKFPYVMRLCFSASHTTRNRGGIVNKEDTAMQD